MHVALVRQRYSAHGGAERFIERARGALGAQGVAVTVLAREWTGDPGTVVRCDPFHVGRVWRDWSFARAVCREVARRPFDLVQSHERIACCDIYRAGDGVHAQWLHNRRATFGALGRFGLALNPYHRYVLAAERRLFESPRLRAVICNSRMVRDEIRAHFCTLEAMACGLPVITTPQCGTAELIEEGVSGYVVGALEVDALADRLARLDVPAAQEMGRRARKRAEGFSLAAMAEQLFARYRSLAPKAVA